MTTFARNSWIVFLCAGALIGSACTLPPAPTAEPEPTGRPLSPCEEDGDCEDGDAYCNGEMCSDNVCVPRSDPCASTGQLCDEEHDRCYGCDRDSDCPDDGEFCNGEAICLDGSCVAGTTPCAVTETCDEETDVCLSPPCTTDADCDDENACTTDSCVNGACENQPIDIDDGLFCTGTETCNPTIGGIMSSGDPCEEDACCDEENDECTKAACINTYSGGSGTESDPYLISTSADFVDLRHSPADYAQHFKQTADIDLADELLFGAVIAADSDIGHDGFQGTAFTGSYDGQGFTIKNCSIVTSFGMSEYVGVFGYNRGHIENVVVDASTLDLFLGQYVGLLCGRNDGIVYNCHAHGQIVCGTGSTHIGGLCGYSYNATIVGSSAGGSVAAGPSSSYVGGFTGRIHAYADRNSAYSYAELCSSIAHVVAGSDSSNIGGFSGTIDCYGYGAMTLGGSRPGTARMYVSSCYSAGDVTVGDNCDDIGGFCGVASTVFKLYASQRHGSAASDIRYCYSVGLVTTGTAPGNTGGFLGRSYVRRDPLNIDHCIWSTDASGLDTSAEGSPLDDAQMQDVNSFLMHGWDFEGYDVNGSEDIWRMPPQSDSYRYPLLAWQEM